MKNSSKSHAHAMQPLSADDDGAVRSHAKRPAWANHRLDQRIVESLIADDPAVIAELARIGISEASVREHAHALGLTWGFIKQCRLSGSRPAMRTCIKCDARFLSSGVDNRLCRHCPPR